MLIAAIAVALVLASGGLGAAITTSNPDTTSEPADPSMIVVDESSTLWPYTSPTTSTADRTLAINVVVYGNTTETRQLLESQSQGEWNVTEAEHEDVTPPRDGAIAGTPTAWGNAHGSTRYVYVESTVDSTGGRWLDESYQLHDGDYFGSRHHVRAYEAPQTGDEWTAIQAHREHWDWFRLGHRVDSVEDSQQYVEREFRDHPHIGDVRRVYLDNAKGSDANGWVTVVDRADRTIPTPLTIGGLVLSSVLVGRVSVHRRLSSLITPRARRVLPVFGSVVTLYLFVRFGSIAVETTVADVDPRLVAGAFYPLLLVGIPAVTYHFARPVDRPAAFGAASVGFVFAIALDYTALGVTRLSLAVLVHRFSVAIALGLIAAGASHVARTDSRDHGFVRTGVLLWLVALAAPLLRFL